MAPGDPVWVANNGTQTSTLYDGNGKVELASGTKLAKLPAGTDNQADGSYGRIDVGATPPMLNKAPVVTITAPPPSTGGGYGGGGTTIGGTVAVTATATDSVAIATVQFFANGASIGTATASPYTAQWNTATVANGTSVALTAKATDVDGNVATSAADTVIVSN